MYHILENRDYKQLIVGLESLITNGWNIIQRCFTLWRKIVKICSNEIKMLTVHVYITHKLVAKAQMRSLIRVSLRTASTIPMLMKTQTKM